MGLGMEWNLDNKRKKNKFEKGGSSHVPRTEGGSCRTLPRGKGVAEEELSPGWIGRSGSTAG